MRNLLRLLVDRDENVPLDVAALELAQIEYPQLSPDPSLALLESMADVLRKRLNPAAEPAQQVEALVGYMAGELGFGGSSTSYADPANHYLNRVLVQRAGMPISVSIVYIEVARRTGLTVHGIGLPGHFLAALGEGSRVCYFDPFHGGRRLTREQCYARAAEQTGHDFSADRTLLDPVSRRYILLRVLNNLKNAYAQPPDPRKLAAILDLQVQADPSNPDQYRQRAAIRSHLRLYRGSASDLRRILELLPQSPDRDEVQSQLQRLERWLASMN